MYMGISYDKAHKNQQTLEENRPAPDINGIALRNSTIPSISLKTWQGSPILVVFFASWCVPCLAEHPYLMKLAASKKFKIYGVAWKDSDANINKYLQDNGNPYDAITLDPDSHNAINYGIHGVPESFVIDKNGVITLRITGSFTQDMQQLLMQR